MTCPDCSIELRPWWGSDKCSTVGCRVRGIRCGGCDRKWESQRIERIYEDLHFDLERQFTKMVGFMDFTNDANEVRDD